MNPDELKAAWKAQPALRPLTIDPELLLQEVQRSQKLFSTMLFWRDRREIGGGIVMVPVLLFIGWVIKLPWTFYLMVPAVLWVAGFMWVDRRRHNPGPPEQGEPLKRCLDRSLAQIEHQIWLLRNVFWWYLLPPGVAIAALLGQFAWIMRSAGWWTVLIFSVFTAFEAVVFTCIYRLNQQCVRSELEPRRQELQALLAGLKDNGERPATAAQRQP
jgi:hypothetical protein